MGYIFSVLWVAVHYCWMENKVPAEALCMPRLERQPKSCPRVRIRESLSLTRKGAQRRAGLLPAQPQPASRDCTLQVLFSHIFHQWSYTVFKEIPQFKSDQNTAFNYLSSWSTYFCETMQQNSYTESYNTQPGNRDRSGHEPLPTPMPTPCLHM